MVKLNMQKIKSIFIIFYLSFLLLGCQTVKEKTDAIVEKENKKLSQYIGKSSDELKTELGNPDEDYKNENGNIELVYYPELGDDYPDMVADGFLPIGRITGGVDSIDKF